MRPTRMATRRARERLGGGEPEIVFAGFDGKIHAISAAKAELWSFAYTTDPNVLVRMAKCCTPVPGDPITGYISVGRGITIHREDCPNVRALMRSPERFGIDDGATTSHD